MCCSSLDATAIGETAVRSHSTGKRHLANVQRRDATCSPVSAFFPRPTATCADTYNYNMANTCDIPSVITADGIHFNRKYHRERCWYCLDKPSLLNARPCVTQGRSSSIDIYNILLHQGQANFLGRAPKR